MAPLPSKEFLEHDAERRRIRSQLENAEEKLERLEGAQLDDFLENQRHTKLVLAEKVKAWKNRVAALKQALETNDDFEADDEPVPSYSAEDWATKEKRLEELEEQDDAWEASSYDAEAEIDAAERGYDPGGDTEPEAEASDDPSDEKPRENDPG